MFFDDPATIPAIATRVGCTVFVIPNSIDIPIKQAIEVAPNPDKKYISMDQIKELIAHLGTKETSDQFIVIHEAETMNPEAANALLKSLEEPSDFRHFILQTTNPSGLLPTILSRSAIFILKTPDPINSGIVAPDNIKELAKHLLTARSSDLPALAEEISKKKDNARTYALQILQTTIEMTYKSYFKTGNQAFLAKLPKFLTAYDNIAKNGHIKLHLVSDLL